MSEFCDIVKLAELLKTDEKESSDSEDDVDNTISVGVSKVSDDVSSTLPPSKKNDDESEKCGNDECFEDQNQEVSDWRKVPEWDVSYRQQVTASDVFLQVGAKTPATSSCEDMILRVYLPGENRQNIDLKIKSERLDLVSPNYRLGIPLPHPVDPQRGDAKWDAASGTLTVTLKMNREFDFVNF